MYLKINNYILRFIKLEMMRCKKQTRDQFLELTQLLLLVANALKLVDEAVHKAHSKCNYSC